MVPRVFVSSTIEDLRDLRGRIRQQIVDLGYDPVMSEHGEIPYQPDQQAEASCYATGPECDLAVVLIGRRYGQRASNKKSVTHNEFDALLAARVPIITLIDKEVLTFKKVYDANPGEQRPAMPGIEDPQGIFAFIEAVQQSPYNNAFLGYTDAADACGILKKQLAGIFRKLLEGQRRPSKPDSRSEQRVGGVCGPQAEPPALRVSYDSTRTPERLPVIDRRSGGRIGRGCYCHLLVSAEGGHMARGCRGRLLEVGVPDGAGGFVGHPQFKKPELLKWANEPDHRPVDIDPDCPRRLDLCMILDTHPDILIFETPKDTLGSRTDFPPGVYLVKVRLDALNAAPADGIFMLQFGGHWDDVSISQVVADPPMTSLPR
jgi:hypothetical protein